MSELQMFYGHYTGTELTTFRSWKSVSDRLNLVFHWLCPLRGALQFVQSASRHALTPQDTMQCRPEIDIAQTMASYTHTCLGGRCNAAGRHSKYGRVLRRTLRSRYDREWTLSWCRILPFYVVQTRRTALPDFTLLQCCISCRRFRWCSCMGMSTF